MTFYMYNSTRSLCKNKIWKNNGIHSVHEMKWPKSGFLLILIEWGESGKTILNETTSTM